MQKIEKTICERCKFRKIPQHREQGNRKKLCMICQGEAEDFWIKHIEDLDFGKPLITNLTQRHLQILKESIENTLSSNEYNLQNAQPEIQEFVNKRRNELIDLKVAIQQNIIIEEQKQETKKEERQELLESIHENQ